jgi:hypothetical protein
MQVVPSMEFQNTAQSIDILPMNESHMDRLEAMSIVVAAVEAGSLSAAGRRLGRCRPESGWNSEWRVLRVT